jgi:hypothetical protein
MAYNEMCSWEWDNLKQPLVDLMLSFYNNDYEEQPQQVLTNITTIFEILSFWRIHGKPNGVPLNAKTLVDFFVEAALHIIVEIREKLV